MEIYVKMDENQLKKFQTFCESQTDETMHSSLDKKIDDSYLYDILPHLPEDRKIEILSLILTGIAPNIFDDIMSRKLIEEYCLRNDTVTYVIHKKTSLKNF